MLIEILGQFNFLDILILILLFRVCYVAMHTGLPVESFKLAGTLASIYLSLHYYVFLSDLIQKKIDLSLMPLEFADFLIFLFLAIIGYLLFMALRGVFFNFIKLEAVAPLSKWGGLFFGILRGLLLVSLICFSMSISSVSYLNKSVKSSYLGSRLNQVAPNTYKWLWDGFFSKFMGSEKFNKEAIMAMHNFFNR